MKNIIATLIVIFLGLSLNIQAQSPLNDIEIPKMEVYSSMLTKITDAQLDSIYKSKSEFLADFIIKREMKVDYEMDSVKANLNVTLDLMDSLVRPVILEERHISYKQKKWVKDFFVRYETRDFLSYLFGREDDIVPYDIDFKKGCISLLVINNTNNINYNLLINKENYNGIRSRVVQGLENSRVDRKNNNKVNKTREELLVEVEMKSIEYEVQKRRLEAERLVREKEWLRQLESKKAVNKKSSTTQRKYRSNYNTHHTESHRCLGTTQKGRQCLRMIASDNPSLYCWQHD